jgi:hypothetical protein
MIRDAVADDITVIDHIPDSVAPPMIAVAWGNPWLVPDTLCGYASSLEILIVSQRIEPGGHMTRIEEMVSQVAQLLHEHKASIRTITAPYPLVLGGVNYLGASINLIHEVEE